MQTWILIAIFSVASVSMRDIPAASAQFGDMDDGWTRRQRIPRTHDEAEAPYMVADGNGTVHAFYSQPVPADGQHWAIVYNSWTKEKGWADPVDIILPPFSLFALIRGAFIDQNGLLHVIYFGGDDAAANIYHSAASVDQAGQARAWSEPDLIGRRARLRVAAMAGDDEGRIYVLYTGDLADNMGLYSVESLDGGASWSEPVPVYLTFDAELFPFFVQLHGDDAGRLHATWMVNNTRGQGQSVYYAGRDRDSEAWNEPVLLSAVGQQDARLEDGVVERMSWPSVFQYGDETIVMYTVCSPCERRIQFSRDGGQTWSQARQPFETRGEYGHGRFLVDSNNTLHLLLVDRARGQTVWHSVRRDDQWQEPQAAIPPSEYFHYASTPRHPLAYDPQRPEAVISQGNTVLVSWVQDAKNCCNGPWYIVGTLDAPELPPVELPTPTAIPASNPTAMVVSSLSTATPMATSPDVAPSNASPEQATSPSTLIVLGLVPAVLIMAAAIVGQRYLRDHRR